VNKKGEEREEREREREENQHRGKKDPLAFIYQAIHKRDPSKNNKQGQKKVRTFEEDTQNALTPINQ
jgi:hypothetical protein